MRAPFVGRDGELDIVLDAVALVPGAGLTAVVVSGEAGIGKSRLLAEVADRVSQRAWRVLRVRADRLERQVPYAALGTALRAVVADNTFTEGLRREALAALDLPLESTPESAGTTFGRACAAVGRLLTSLTAPGPLVLSVDDLHELDDDSLALLAVVLNRLSSAPIGLVVALRGGVAEPNAAAQELMDRLTESVEVVHVELGTLARTDLGTVIASALGASPDDDLLAEVHRRADGNPYFAAEIARSLADAQIITVDAGVARLTVAPRTLRLTRRAAVLRRVMPLGAQALAVARTLAVLRLAGLDRIGLIARVTALSQASVTVAFDDLVRANVVEGDAEGGYRFSHDIVADAVYDEIGPAECRRLHRLCAEELLAERGRGETELLRLAWHVSESASPGDTLAVQVLTEAARYALSNAPEAAAGFSDRALLLLKDAAPERGGLLALRCRAMARAARPAAAVAAGREALALLAPGPERWRTATAVLSSLFSLGHIDEALAVADGLMSARDVPAAIHAQRALLLVFADRTEEALREAALATSTPTISAAEDVVVCAQLTMVTSMLFRHSDTVEYAERAMRSAGSSTTLQLQALGVAASAEALAGLLPDAALRLRRAEQLAPEGPHLFGDELGVARVVVDWLGGRWDPALESLRTLTAELTNRQQIMLAAALIAVELEMRTWRGELSLAVPLTPGSRQWPRNVASLHSWALSGFQSARGDVPGAFATIKAALAAPATPTYGGLLLSRLAELQLDQGRHADADRALSQLTETTAAHVTPWATTTLHRTIGLVRGDIDALVEAVHRARDAGLVFEQARAQFALGERDPSSVEHLVEAHQTFARLGTHGLRRVAARRLHQLGAKVPRSRSRAGGLLTESEERVARLVQQGMRNRDIAAALHFSPRSVEVYLSRIYAKLRVSSRLELARALDAMPGTPKL